MEAKFKSAVSMSQKKSKNALSYPSLYVCHFISGSVHELMCVDARLSMARLFGTGIL